MATLSEIFGEKFVFQQDYDAQKLLTRRNEAYFEVGEVSGISYGFVFNTKTDDETLPQELMPTFGGLYDMQDVFGRDLSHNTISSFANSVGAKIKSPDDSDIQVVWRGQSGVFVTTLNSKQAIVSAQRMGQIARDNLVTMLAEIDVYSDINETDGYEEE